MLLEILIEAQRDDGIKMVDWEIIMKELNDLIDNDELTRKSTQNAVHIRRCFPTQNTD